MVYAELIEKQPKGPNRCSFATGAWTLVLRSRFSGFETGSAAMERLCGAYFPAMEEFLFHWNGDREWAKRSGREFIGHLISGNCLRYLRSDVSHFRHFLLGTLQIYLADSWKTGSTPSRTANALDAFEATRRFGRKWAMTAIQRAINQMTLDAQGSDSPELYCALCDFLSGSREIPYQSFTATFRLSNGATKVALQRLRFRFSEFLRAEIRETVQSDELVFDELQTLSQFAS